jgi:O-antigen/teichoic acid export membrane protein
MLTHLGKDIAVYGVSDFSFKLLAFAVFPIYAHVFSVRDFGIIELVTVSSGLLSMLCGLGLNNAVQRFYWEPGTSRERQSTIVTMGLLLQGGVSMILVALTLVGLYPFRHELDTDYGIPWVVTVLAICSIVPSIALQFVLDVLRLHFSPWRFTAVAFLRNALGTAVGLILILAFGFGISGIFIGTIAAVTLAFPLGLWMIARDLHSKLDWEIVRTLFEFGYPFIFVGVAYWIFGSLDRWMLAELSSVENVGLYGIAFKFATVVMFVNTAFGQAWSPWAMKVRAERIDYLKVYSRVLSLWFLTLTLVGCILSLFSKELLILTTPEPYWPAANILVIAIMGVVFLGTTQVTALGISIEKRTRIFAVTAWLAAGANFLLNLLLIPDFGALGAAAATSLTYLGLSGTYLYWTQKLHPMPLEWPRLYGIFLVGILTIPIAWVLNREETGLLMILVKMVIPICLIVVAWQQGFFKNSASDLIGSRPSTSTAG